MCGRTSLFVPQSTLETRFSARVVSDGGYTPRFNIAPTQPIEAITSDAPDNIVQHTWGLLPSWADGFDDGFINARAETAHEKPSFESAWAQRPCLVLSSGFYEWQQRNGGQKQPHRIYRDDDPAFAMAGLWEPWTGGEHDEPIPTVTILTTDANELIEPIHDRMPVVLRQEDEATWLAAGPSDRHDLCQPYPADDLAAYPISTFVNDPSHDDARVIESLETDQADLGDFE
jgi:putative SOS response-associated peptidase YedK